MSTNKDNKASRKQRNDTLVSGLQKYAATLPTLTVGSETIKSADVIAALQADNAATAAVAPAKTAWQKAVRAAHDQSAQTAVIAAKARKALLFLYAGKPEVLVDFGIAEPKPRTPLTAEQQAAKAAKARATRAARHTMGSQQKKAVVGNVTGVTVTPVVEAPVTAAPAAAVTPKAQ